MSKLKEALARITQKTKYATNTEPDPETEVRVPGKFRVDEQQLKKVMQQRAALVGPVG